jgi:hypothetical protein
MILQLEKTSSCFFCQLYSFILFPLNFLLYQFTVISEINVLLG